MFECNQYKKFHIENDIITWKQKHYHIRDIVHLYLRNVITTQRLNFVNAGEARSSDLYIVFKNKDEIILSFDEATIFLGWNRDKTKDFNNLFDLYIY